MRERSLQRESVREISFSSTLFDAKCNLLQGISRKSVVSQLIKKFTAFDNINYLSLASGTCLNRFLYLCRCCNIYGLHYTPLHFLL
jgi:hypothetical protein